MEWSRLFSGWKCPRCNYPLKKTDNMCCNCGQPIKFENETTKANKENILVNTNFDDSKDEKFFDLWMKPLVIGGLWAINRRLSRTYRKGDTLPTRLQMIMDSAEEELTLKKDGFFVKYFVTLFIGIVVMFMHKDPAYCIRLERVHRRYLKKMKEAKMVI